MQRVIVAMDDESILRSLRLLLSGHGFEVEAVSGAGGCLGALDQERASLAIVGRRLMDGDGLWLCRVLAERFGGQMPVIVVGATGSSDEAYECFEAGARDYLRQPLDPLEVAWRARAHLERARCEAPDERLSAGELTLDLRNHRLGAPGADVPVTPSECAILRLLMTQPGRAVTIETLLVEALGYPPRLGNPEVVRTHVRNLRLKLEADPHRPKLLVNRPRVGYVLEAARARAS